LDKLDKRLECVLIKKVSDAGININQAKNSKYYGCQISFIPGLGFRMAEKVIEDLRI